METVKLEIEIEETYPNLTVMYLNLRQIIKTSGYFWFNKEINNENFPAPSGPLRAEVDISIANIKMNSDSTEIDNKSLQIALKQQGLCAGNIFELLALTPNIERLWEKKILASGLTIGSDLIIKAPYISCQRNDKYLDLIYLDTIFETAWGGEWKILVKKI